MKTETTTDATTDDRWGPRLRAVTIAVPLPRCPRCRSASLRITHTNRSEDGERIVRNCRCKVCSQPFQVFAS